MDAISDRLTFRMPYRNLASGQRIVLNHTVDTNGADLAGIRWYELQNTGSGWSIRQQGTYAPADGNHRWMGSIAMNDNGDIALAYSVAGAAVSPSLRFTGRMAADSLGQMTQPESTIIEGSGYQSHSTSRWGDYAHMSTDPIDPAGFWFTGEYLNSVSSASWRTRIAQLSLAGAPPPPSGYSHVGDLDRTTGTSRNTWQARVTVTVHNENHVPLANATVSASWSGGYSGSGSCVTGVSGTCTISSGNMNNKKISATLTVTAISHAANSYSAGSNHDPDSDSNGTVITVSKP